MGVSPTRNAHFCKSAQADLDSKLMQKWCRWCHVGPNRPQHNTKMAPRRLQVGSKTPQVCHYMRDNAVRWICRGPRWLEKAKMSVSPTRNTHFCKAMQANLGPYWGNIRAISVPSSAPRSLQDGLLGLLLGSLGVFWVIVWSFRAILGLGRGRARRRIHRVCLNVKMGVSPIRNAHFCKSAQVDLGCKLIKNGVDGVMLV